MANLRSVILAWRDNEASKKGIELFRVLPNSAIDDIVRALPKTKDELTAIKGIKDAKFLQYGAAILNMVKESSGTVPTEKAADAMARIGDSLPPTRPKEERTLYSVSSYLDVINRELWRLRAPIKGEVTSFKFQGSAVYFSIRDNDDGSTLSVFMWMNDFTLAGIELTEGLLVVVEGRSEIYKPSGRFNFRADTIELVGEGAFKKAYEEMRKRLDGEGLFDESKKQQLVELPVRIGLITSRGGAVIHDFLNNLGRFGYQISFVDARVEGASAVKEILSAITYFETKKLDALILVRGGGSLESLQAFNNEYVVRKIASFPAVTICAIGHDKDVPLVQLAADYAPSTPTAATVILNASWEGATHELTKSQFTLLSLYERAIWREAESIRGIGVKLESTLELLFAPFKDATRKFPELLFRVSRQLATIQDSLSSTEKNLTTSFSQQIRVVQQIITNTKIIFEINDPMRQLKLGFSILTKNGKVLRSTEEVNIGEDFEVRLVDGTLRGELKGKRSN